MAEEFKYQTMLNAQLAAIEEGHMMVDRDSSLPTESGSSPRVSSMKAQGLEGKCPSFMTNWKGRENWREEMIKPAEERAEAAQARLMELDKQITRR